MSTEALLISPAAVQPPSKMTYEQFLAWHPEGQFAEWKDGETLLMAPPSTLHQRVAAFLFLLLTSFVESKDLGEVLFAPVQMKLASSGREPDLVFVAQENLTRIENLYLHGPADLAVEVISPESRDRDRTEKFGEYERAGVREYWLIDPSRRQADFYALGDDGKYHAITLNDQGFMRSAVLEGFSLQVDWLWQYPLPKLAQVNAAWASSPDL